MAPSVTASARSAAKSATSTTTRRTPESACLRKRPPRLLDDRPHTGPGGYCLACVMLVEDDRALRNLMNAILRTAGHEVVLAEDAESALDRLKNDQELILLDLGLPDLDGSTFLAEAMNRGYDGKV